VPASIGAESGGLCARMVTGVVVDVGEGAR
jgi:hypothetical protein